MQVVSEILRSCEGVSDGIKWYIDLQPEKEVIDTIRTKNSLVFPAGARGSVTGRIQVAKIDFECSVARYSAGQGRRCSIVLLVRTQGPIDLKGLS